MAFGQVIIFLVYNFFTFIRNNTQFFAGKSSMVLCMFSHTNLVHLAFDMYILSEYAPNLINQFLGVNKAY